MFYFVSNTKRIESPPEFGAIVGLDSAGIPKQLKDFLADDIGNGGTTFIID